MRLGAIASEMDYFGRQDGRDYERDGLLWAGWNEGVDEGYASEIYYNPGKLAQEHPLAGKNSGRAEILHNVVISSSDEHLIFPHPPPLSYFFHGQNTNFMNTFPPISH